jgi:transposase
MCKFQCYKTCINNAFLLNEEFLKHAQEIITELNIKSRVGRPPIDFEQGLQGIYYLLRTGIIWKALPHCFGSSSAIHRLFQKLRSVGFFTKLWHKELQIYDQIHGLQLEIQSGDCSHIRAPLGQEKTGESPVDRKKLGTKRSIIVEKTGIVIGASLSSGNRHDSKLFFDSMESIPSFLQQPDYKEMHLDAAYDFKSIRTFLLNKFYVPKISKNKRNSKVVIPFKPEKKRWIVESAHSWMNRFRRLLIRFEKYAQNYFAFMTMSFAITIFNRL